MSEPRTCSIDGCEGRYYARGWCKQHYHRWYRRGEPTPLEGRNGWYDTLPTCPACGGTRSTRSLLVCSTCWAKAPEQIRLEAYNAAKTDRSLIAIGDVAAKLLVSIALARVEEEKTGEVVVV